MKKLLAFIVALMILMCPFAFADESYVGNMEVVNCREWVSLRAEPSTEAERLTKVPVGSIVEECVAYDDGWVYGLYCGMYGYISADYLAETDAVIDYGYDLYYENGGHYAVGTHEYTDGGEVFHVAVYDEGWNTVWSRDITCSYTTELQLVDAFIAGTNEKPLVMAYSADTGLTALDFFTGETVWMIPDSTLSLGGSICWGVDNDGTVYIGGYYGPDPLAISAGGEILWQTDFKGTYYWLHTIEVYGEHLICYFDMDDTTYEPVTVMLAKNGDFMGLVYQ